jgi:WD40 repeat protein
MGMAQTDRSDVFLSYRRKDVDFAKQMDAALKATGREVWVDWEDIPPGVEGFTDEIQRGIDGADAFICLLSPNYLESEYCLMELDYAVQRNKRLVPVIIDKFEGDAPSGIGHINWVYFTPHAGQENTFDESFPKVVAALEQDLGHIRNHTRLLLRAQEWDEKDRHDSFLMDGAEVEEGEHWLLKAESLTPEPLPLHREYIAASRALETAKERRARAILSAGLAVAVVLLVVAAILAVLAEQNRQTAELALIEADEQRAIAVGQALFAEQVALMSNSQLTLYRDSSTDLAIALALKAHEVGVEELEPESYRVLSEAVYHPGTRHVFTGHERNVSSLDVSAEGTRAVSGDDGGVVHMWDVMTGETIFVIEEAHSDIIWDIEISPDETFFVTGSADGRIKVWDMATGDLLHDMGAVDPADLVDEDDDGELDEVPRDNVRTIAITPDNAHVLATYDNDPIIQMYEIVTGDVVREFRADDEETVTVEGHSNVVRDIEFMPNLPTFVSGDQDGNLLVWNWQTGALSSKILTGSAIYTLTLTDNGQRVFVAGQPQTVELWNLVSRRKVGGAFEGHSASIYQLALSPDGTQLLTASQDLSIRLWDVETRKTVNLFVGHENYAYQVEFLPNGTQFMSSSWDDTLRLWDTVTQEHINRLEGHEGVVYQITYDSAGERILSAGGDTTARIWDAQTGENIQTFGTVLNEDVEVGHTGIVIGAAWSPDETRIATIGNENYVSIWDVETGEILLTLPADDDETDELEGHEATGWTVVWLNDTQVLSGGFDDRVILWDAETGELLRTFEGHTNGVLSIEVLDEERFITGSWDRRAMLWDVNEEEAVRVYEGHTNWIWDVEIAPNGEHFMTASADQTMILWRVDSETPQRRYLGHDDSVLRIAFSPDGTQVVTSGRDEKILLWDVALAAPMRRYNGHTDWVRAVDFNPQGATLVTGGNDRDLLIWETQSLEDLMTWTDENRFVRDLTCGERDRYRVEPYCAEGATDDGASE